MNEHPGLQRVTQWELFSTSHPAEKWEGILRKLASIKNTRTYQAEQFQKSVWMGIRETRNHKFCEQ